jgi:hypothetical protein
VGRLHAVHEWHLQVHQHEVGVQRLHHFDGLRRRAMPITSIFGLALGQRATLANNFLIIDDENADHGVIPATVR